MNNYPAGVSPMHPHFAGPATCPSCKDDFDGETCECGFTVSDLAAEKADHDYERLREREA